MKKTFDLTHPKIKVPRLVESARGEIKKYLKRERRVALPEGVDFWDFDCRCGPTAEESEVIHVAGIGKFIDTVEQLELDSFYVEILAKPGHRRKRPKVESKDVGPDPTK